MGDTSETNTKVLSRELFLGLVALKTPIQTNHYLRDKVPFANPVMSFLVDNYSSSHYLLFSSLHLLC